MRKTLLILAILMAMPFTGTAQCTTPCGTPCTNSDKVQCDNTQTIKWMSFEEAIEANKTVPKKIFIDVFTDWCGWCKKMDQTTFLNKEVIEYMNENFYAVKFDAEQSDTIVFAGYTFVNQGSKNGRKGTHQLAAALLQGKMSYPSYVFMNEKNQLLTVAPGYMEASNLIPVLKYFGTDSYLNMKYNDFIKQDSEKH
ncbi:MAG: DUF255 domain-containing protein [Bacteroidales bacterium]|nr:DUF255 domain-containing protein [Bacteroidales bacterium]